MACIAFAESQAEEKDQVIGATSTYRLVCSFDILDPKADDQYAFGESFKGKLIKSGTWDVYSDSLEYVMNYAETLMRSWASDRELSIGDAAGLYPYPTGTFEVFRLGLPLLQLAERDGKERWGAVGDDCLDPWMPESVSDTQLVCLPDETAEPDMDLEQWVETVCPDGGTEWVLGPPLGE